jgi:hypothetical protein
MAETELNYNYERDYDPQVGRYIESDPIGLSGGSYSTYSYANGSPLMNSDPAGDNAIAIGAGIGSAIEPGVGTAIGAAIGGIVTAVGIYEMCHTCPECSPFRKGTIGYIGPHSDHDHFPVGRPHLNLFVVNQDPSSCKCFWNKNAPDVAKPPPSPNWIDLNSGFPPLSP